MAICSFPAYLMDNFIVVGSNRSFPSSPPDMMTGPDYHLCGQYPDTPPVGDRSMVVCSPYAVTARYVYIQVNSSNELTILELCEVWVYASKSPCISYILIFLKKICIMHYTSVFFRRGYFNTHLKLFMLHSRLKWRVIVYECSNLIFKLPRN